MAIRMMEATFGGRLKWDVKSKKQRPIKGIAKKKIIRKNSRYWIRDHLRLIDSHLPLSLHFSNLRHCIEWALNRYRGFVRPSFIDNAEDMQEPDSNDLMNRDNICNHGRNKIRHNMYQDSKVHNTGREPQSLRPRIRFDCRTLRAHTRLGLSIALLTVNTFSFLLPFLLGDIGQAYSLNPFP